MTWLRRLFAWALKPSTSAERSRWDDGSPRKAITLDREFTYQQIAKVRKSADVVAFQARRKR